MPNGYPQVLPDQHLDLLTGVIESAQVTDRMVRDMQEDGLPVGDSIAQNKAHLDLATALKRRHFPNQA